MWPTDANGATSFNSIVPGFYVRCPITPLSIRSLTSVKIGRTLHIHVQVHTNWTITSNGTIDHSRVVETGQIYFDEKLTEELMAVEPYASHTQIDRVVNDDDGVFLQQVQCNPFPRLFQILVSSADRRLKTAGAMNVVDAEPLDGVDFKNGVLAYITLVRCISNLGCSFDKH
jgi:protocatechuate 3,4-dioxygenase beta subunit